MRKIYLIASKSPARKPRVVLEAFEVEMIDELIEMVFLQLLNLTSILRLQLMWLIQPRHLRLLISSFLVKIV